MDENLNPVNEGQEQTVDAQTTNTDVQAEPIEADKTDNAEVVEPQQTKTVQSQEDNAKYAAARRKAEAEAAQKIAETKDSTAAEMAKMSGWTNPDGSPITTLEQYQKAITYSKLVQNGIDPKEYETLRENDPDVQEARRLKAEMQKREKESANVNEFFREFESATGRAFDVKTDAQVYLKVKTEAGLSGKSYADAYTKIHNQELSQRIADLEAKMKASETNKANADSSPGSVSANGNTAASDDYISPETFEANRGNRSWVVKNFDRIMKSRPKWGG
jgi:hypothetical protein